MLLSGTIYGSVLSGSGHQTMEQASCSYDAVTARITLIALPVEVLVYIISFLATREIVGIR